MSDMQQYKITENEVSRKGMASAPDRLTGTAAENKALFDRLVREVVAEKHNDLIDAMDAALDGKQDKLNAANGTGNNSVVLGDTANNDASGDYAAAEGYKTEALGPYCHAEGYRTKAERTSNGRAAHAEGEKTRASGSAAHAEGSETKASGSYSHAEGNGTIANHRAQHVFGEYNMQDPSSAHETERGDFAEIVGNGSSDSARSNARTLDWNGNEILAGKLTLGAPPTNPMDAVPLDMVLRKMVVKVLVPNNTTPYERIVLTGDFDWAICIGIWAPSGGGCFCQLTDGDFAYNKTPVIKTEDRENFILCFTLSEERVQKMYGPANLPFTAVIIYGKL